MRAIATGALMIALLAAPFCAHARTWYVKADGTGDAPTIQAGIDSAAAGDTVLVASGTYTGAGNKDLGFGGKDLVMRSEAGQEVTIIDCEGDGRGLRFYSGESSASVIEGFTVTNGSVRGDGGGMYCKESSPTIRNCTFSWNSGGFGGGMVCYHNLPTITNCTFVGNSATSGGGIHVFWAGSPLPPLTNCIFSGNSAIYGGGIYAYITPVTLVNCTFSQNSATKGGGAYWEYYCNSTLDNCTFAQNSADAGGGMYCERYSCPGASNTIIAFSSHGEAIYCEEGSGAGFACCDVYGNAGGDWVGCIAGQDGVNGNISGDPLFCGEDNYPGDPYRLDIASPCAVRNSPCGELIGARPAGCSGSVSTEAMTWGRVKALYR